MRPQLPIDVTLPEEVARLCAKLNRLLDKAESGELARVVWMDGFRTGILAVAVIAVGYLLYCKWRSKS